MGISGLIPLLREAQRSGHVKEFSGQSVGVDSYIWLYKGAFSCASDLALNIPTTKYIAFFMARARMLRHYGIDPLFVFDGGPLPSKLHTELERQRNRAERRLTAVQLWNQQKRKLAYEQFQRCVEVTPQMAKAVIEVLRGEGFRCLVAPYEADAQLAYLEAQGLIVAAISEDSDLIAYGCRNIIFKLDQYGEAVIFDRQKLPNAKAVDVKGWSTAQVRRMCILSGCDYVPSVPGVGLKKAHRYVARSHDISSAVLLMRADKLSVPDEYEAEAVRAELTFRFQRVYDPRAECLAFVTPLGDGAPAVEDMPFIGIELEPHVARGIAVAELDPITYLPFNTQTVGAPQPTHATQSSSQTAQAPPPKATGMAKTSAAARAKAPVVRARSLQSFWGKPKPPQTRSTPIAVEQTPGVIEPPDCAIVPSSEGEVNVKFRANDQHTTLVSTAQKSRFFAKPPTDAVADDDAQVAAATTDLLLASTQVASADLSAASSQIVVTPLSQCETVVDDIEVSIVNQPRLLRSGSVIGLPRLSSPRRPLTSADDARAISLFGQFSRNGSGDIPEYAKHPTYKKAAPMRNGASPLRVGRMDLLQGPRTPITLMAKRLSNDRLALQPLDANTPLFGSSPPHSAKRKQGGGLMDNVKKFRYVASAPSLALPLDDDIVDSDTENRAITV